MLVTAEKTIVEASTFRFKDALFDGTVVDGVWWAVLGFGLCELQVNLDFCPSKGKG